MRSPQGGPDHRHIWRELAPEDAVCAALLIGVLTVMGLGVFFRYVLNDSLSWTEEISRYGLVYITYIGCATAVRRRSHIRIDVIARILPASGQRILAVIVDLLTLVFLAFLAVTTFRIMDVLWTSRSAAVGLPINFVYVAIFLGMVASIIRLLEHYVPWPKRDTP